MFAILLLSAVGVLAKSVRAIEVVTGSQCFGSCGGGSTATTDLVCNDADYAGTQYGQKMSGCLSCESTSLFVNTSMPNGGTTDEYWFMFNMKYTLQTCVIDSNSKIAPVQACSSECTPLQPVLDTLWIAATPYANQYDYCSVNSGSFPVDAPKCASCLQGQTGSVVLGNFVQIMSDACTSRPLAENGDLISLHRALLDTSTISIATSSAKSSSTATASDSAGTSAAGTASTAVSSGSVSNPTAAAASNTSTSSSSGLSSGAAAGIGIAIGVLALAALAGLAFWILRRRKQRQQSGMFAPEVPAYTPAPPAKHVQEKDSFSSPSMSDVGTHELHGQERYEAGGAYPDDRSGPVELDAGRS